MMQELNMSALLDIGDLPGINGEEVVTYEPLELVEVSSNPNNRKPDLEDDYTVVRKNMHFQSQMLMDAAKIFLETAKNSDSPRHMEVFSNLIGQMTNTNKELLRLHKEMKEITDEKVAPSAPPSGQMNIQNATVFVGSPSDMMDEFGDAYEAQEKQEKLING
ncbi:terminase small subunit [Pseudomonas phage PspYZU05]|uniref:Terminase DNA packaging enzyme small subunit n=1 Tax=Pseudomonas phage PspYZU05 TaxID=1983556 RepID=A0A2U7NN20_9CAUD|nr:terminase small subunit [Pseudomonas phage PspYZU05]ASD52077.1 terminase DNA packaging enzyme small subunit [Pseudomonas phage PspYZU05]